MEEVKKLIKECPELLTEPISGWQPNSLRFRTINDSNRFQFLVLNNQIEEVKVLLRTGCITKEMLDAEIDYDETLLYKVVNNKFTEMAKLLLDAGADYTIKYVSYSHIIHLAAKEGLTEVVGKLLEQEPELINLQNRNSIFSGKKAPLHYAAEAGYKKLVELLVEQKADVNLESKYGYTPLKLARRNNHHSIANYLIEVGNAIDHEYNQLMKELSILHQIIHHADWAKQGYTLKLFESPVCLPVGIEWARNNFTDPKTLNRDEVFKLAEKLKYHDFGFSLSRSDDTKNLYTLFRNLGNNRDKDFNVLDTYRVSADDDCSLTISKSL